MSSIRARCPALIITDLEMPQVNGIELCRRVRYTSSVPIIVVSGNTDRRSEVAALDAGADDYLAKPFSTDTLLARVRVALRRSTELPEPGRSASANSTSTSATAVFGSTGNRCV